MKTHLYPLIWLVSSLTCPLLAQMDSLPVDSLVVDTLQLQQTIHDNYSYFTSETGRIRQTNYKQTTEYDSNGVVIRQQRNHFQPPNEEVITRRYLLEYNPNTLRGFYQTEQLPVGNKPHSIKKTTFKNYDRASNKRYWVKTQKPNSTQLLRQVRYEYDKNGYLIGKESTNYATKPTSISSEKVTRNAAGNMLTWLSYDDDGDTKTQARSFSASYLHDTLLLRSDDQLYFNYTTVINQYDKNGQLKKTDKRVGSRSTKGKVKYNNETITIYKEGRPYKLTEKNFKKKVRTITYAYQANEETQQVVTPEKSYTERITTTYSAQFPDLLLERTATKEGQPFLTETWVYKDSSRQLVKHIVLEKRDNGKDWKNVERYNEHGAIMNKKLFVGGNLTTEDKYLHIYK